MKTTKIFAIGMMVIVCLLMLIIPGEAMAVLRYGDRLCHEQPESYSCFKVPKGESWENLFPDDNQRATVMRINRMNIALRPGMVIAIPQDLNNLNYMDYAPFDHHITATGEKEIIVNPKVLAFGAYNEQGDLVRWGPVAMGKDWCPDLGSSCRTKTGSFKVYREGTSECESTKFPIPDGGAPMPYCMFFNGGYALHASTDVPGYHASHGCVRIFYEDAEWLNQDFVEKGTNVTVLPYET